MIAVPLPTNRDLFITLDMLRAEGLDARLRASGQTLEVRLDDHAAVFRSPTELHAAANWLAECALMHYPDSVLVKLWLFLAKAAATTLTS